MNVQRCSLVSRQRFVRRFIVVQELESERGADRSRQPSINPTGLCVLPLEQHPPSAAYVDVSLTLDESQAIHPGRRAHQHVRGH